MSEKEESTATSEGNDSNSGQNAPTDLSEYIQKMFKHENDLSKEQALKLCSNHIRGLWKTCSVDDLDLSIIT